MSYEVTLLVFGILLLLIGLIGKVKAQQLEVGTDSAVARVVIAIFGSLLVVFSLNPDVPRSFIRIATNPSATSQPDTQTLDQPTPTPIVEKPDPASVSPNPAPPAPATEDLAKVAIDKKRAEVDRLLGLGIDSLNRLDYSLVLSRARFPFFIGNFLIPTREQLNVILHKSAEDIREVFTIARVVRLNSLQVTALKEKDWFPRIRSDLPPMIEDEDWAGLIVMQGQVDDRPLVVTYIAFLRFENGEWRLLGGAGDEGDLE